jgi:hypothetical protein
MTGVPVVHCVHLVAKSAAGHASGCACVLLHDSASMDARRALGAGRARLATSTSSSCHQHELALPPAPARLATSTSSPCHQHELALPPARARLATSTSAPCHQHELVLPPARARLATSTSSPCHQDELVLPPSPARLATKTSSSCPRTSASCHHHQRVLPPSRPGDDAITTSSCHHHQLVLPHHDLAVSHHDLVLPITTWYSSPQVTPHWGDSAGGVGAGGLSAACFALRARALPVQRPGSVSSWRERRRLSRRGPPRPSSASGQRALPAHADRE